MITIPGMVIIGSQPSQGGADGSPPVATPQTAGTVKPGDGLGIKSDGTLFIDTEGFEPESLINATWSI